MTQYTKKTKIGYITITIQNEFITNLELNSFYDNKSTTNCVLAEKTFQQLDEYFNLKRKTFNIPIAPKGTSFQQKVWLELQKIPYGTTVSYKYIAEQINNPYGYRAVGMANNKNPIPIIIPCHRVIGKNGTLTGYALGLEIKNFLISLEKTKYFD